MIDEFMVMVMGMGMGISQNWAIHGAFGDWSFGSQQPQKDLLHLA
jgi:hypothetical protein